MRIQVVKAWNRVRSSFWFLPAVINSGAILLAFIAVALDEPVTNWLTLNWGWTFTGGAEGASSLLGVIAGSMITIAGVVFSMTLVALSLASSQLGPRLLRSFMNDTITQTVLGIFVATFLYCLVVLRTIRAGDEIIFVPHLSVTLGVLLAIVGVGLLIYFIHHVSVSIQANEAAAQVGSELIEGITHLFPENIGQEASQIPTELPSTYFLETFDREAYPINSTGAGYLQFVDGATLMSLAIQKDVVIQLKIRPGHYVVAGRPLVLVWPGTRVSNQMVESVNSTFVLGNQRTVFQDIEFAVNQLVEIAVRALSPGINDPFTAITCVDRLGSALSHLAQRDIPEPYRYDSQDQLRLITPIFTFSDVMDTAFNQIRQYSHSSIAVTIRLLEITIEVAQFANRPEDRAVLLRHAKMVVREARSQLSKGRDLREVEENYQTAKQLLSGLE